MKKGFSLVEILVVVTIISVLASIAAVSYSRFVKQSKDARRKTDIEQIRASIEMYRNFNSVYPTPAGATGMAFGTGNITDASATKYMSLIPNDPTYSASDVTTTTYYYTSSGTYQDYTLCAYLENVAISGSAPDCGGENCNYCMGPYGQTK